MIDDVGRLIRNNKNPMRKRILYNYLNASTSFSIDTDMGVYQNWQFQPALHQTWPQSPKLLLLHRKDSQVHFHVDMLAFDYSIQTSDTFPSCLIVLEMMVLCLIAGALCNYTLLGCGDNTAWQGKKDALLVIESTRKIPYEMDEHCHDNIDYTW